MSEAVFSDVTNHMIITHIVKFDMKASSGRNTSKRASVDVLYGLTTLLVMRVVLNLYLTSDWICRE